ncbi:HU family DNA-binding protein [Flexithrix dorotheae]|uniref:HU family DNA-binding protein n=1 Tax=Flexithrix dorotheae TaxID=70993 RepID=UPI00036F6309|nr:HU family DNA-binding protein [Flexithrix dorotheae]
MVEQYLMEALLEKEKVSIPGFGTFSTEVKNAIIREDEGVIMPPTKKVNFVDDTAYSLGYDSLVEFVVEKKHVTAEEIEEDIKKFNEKVKEAVENGERITIEGLGHFEKGVFNNIAFKPIEEPNIFPASFGLPKIQVKPSAVSTSTKNRVGDPKNKDKNKKISEATLWTILVPAVVIAVFAVWLLIDKGAQEKAFALIDSFQSSSEVEEEPKTITLNPVGQKDDQGNSEAANNEPNPAENNNTPTENKTSEPNENPAPQSTPEEPVSASSGNDNNGVSLIENKTGRWYMSVASFTNQTQAEKGLQKAKNKGYSEAKIVKAGSDKFRLSIADYAKKSDADQKAEEAKSDYSSIWVFKF